MSSQQRPLRKQRTAQKGHVLSSQQHQPATQTGTNGVQESKAVDSLAANRCVRPLFTTPCSPLQRAHAIQGAYHHVLLWQGAWLDGLGQALQASEAPCKARDSTRAARRLITTANRGQE